MGSPTSAVVLVKDGQHSPALPGRGYPVWHSPPGKRPLAISDRYLKPSQQTFTRALLCSTGLAVWATNLPRQTSPPDKVSQTVAFQTVAFASSLVSVHDVAHFPGEPQEMCFLLHNHMLTLANIRCCSKPPSSKAAAHFARVVAPPECVEGA